MPYPVDIAEHLRRIRQRIAAGRAASPLAAGQVTLIAVSKGQGAEKIAAAIDAGQVDFGENKVQEAAKHWGAGCRASETRNPKPVLHLIGPLQTNKAKEAVALFDVIHTLDREKLADTLAAEMEKQGRHLPCFIQVNTGEEPQKSGVSPKDAQKLLDYARAAKLNIIGLMCIPPAGENPAPHFALLRKLAERLGLSELSMGMSGDYEEAIRLGATHIRLGTAIFGEREGAWR